jgi:hypothetical protein
VIVTALWSVAPDSFVSKENSHQVFHQDASLEDLERFQVMIIVLVPLMPSRVGPYSAPSCVGQGQIIGLMLIVQALHATRPSLLTGPCVAPARIFFKTLETKFARSPSRFLLARVIMTEMFQSMIIALVPLIPLRVRPYSEPSSVGQVQIIRSRLIEQALHAKRQRLLTSGQLVMASMERHSRCRLHSSDR